MLAAGREVDRYRVETQIGSGGMATVYRVRHTRLGSVHALKVLKVGGHEIQERLVQEGRVQAQLRHPNIVAVTDVVDVDGAPGLVMDHVDGPALDAWLKDHRPSLDEALALFDGIVSAVARAHRDGLVHRDLKPGNVLLETGDRGLVPKVADFGLAKILADSGTSITRTRSGVAVGTPQYMAPEQVRDASRVDPRADIFALGCILYELVCGVSPFAYPDILSVMNAVVAGQYAPPETHAPQLPERVRAAIAGALQVDRERRIPDCATLQAVLSGAVTVPRAATTRPAEARPASSGTPSRASWAALALGGGALVALSGAAVLALALGAWWWQHHGGADEPAAEPVAAVVEPPAEPATVDVVAEPPSEPPKHTLHKKRPPPQPVVAASAAPAETAPATVATAAAPAVREVSTGGVLLTSGTTDGLWLVDVHGQRHDASQAPPGVYTLWARFGAEEVPAAQSVRIEAGRITRVKCVRAWKTCAPE